jgi:hypothetical protein
MLRFALISYLDLWNSRPPPEPFFASGYSKQIV